MSISLATVLSAIHWLRAEARRGAARSPRPGWIRARQGGVMLVLLALAATGVRADDVSDEAVTGLLSEQSAWLAEQAMEPAPALPGVDFERQAALQRRCFPDFPEPLGARIKGAYDPGEGRIYLDAALDLADRRDQSYLLHELVHHFQVHGVRFGEDDPAEGPAGPAPSGAESRSRGRLEGEAYRLQLRWLEHVGVAEPLRALGLDERTLRLIEHSLH